MKAQLKYLSCLIFLATLLPMAGDAAAAAKGEVVTIQTSAVCEKCKARIEKALKVSDGVMEAYLNLNNKKVKVKYDSAKLSPDQIRTIISNTGYDADNVKANTTSFNSLPKCCRKE